MKILGEVKEAKECDRCRTPLFLIATKDDRVVAAEQRNGYQHVCFDIPADANLIVMRD